MAHESETSEILNITQVEFLHASRENVDSITEEIKPFIHISWEAIVELDKLVSSCMDTKLAHQWSGNILALRLLQGIRSDLIEVARKMERALFSSCGPILRTALENTAVLVAISQKPELIARLQSGELRTTQCIAIANKVFNGLGRHYGKLTESGVHQKWDTLGINLKPIESEKRHELLRLPEHNPFQDIPATYISESVLWLCFMSAFIAELMFKSALPTFSEIILKDDVAKTNPEGIFTKLIEKQQRLNKEYRPNVMTIFARLRKLNL